MSQHVIAIGQTVSETANAAIAKMPARTIYPEPSQAVDSNKTGCRSPEFNARTGATACEDFEIDLPERFDGEPL